ncbi:MAG TPA: hypothetical protein VKK31_01880 [Thermoanaerobaculia bacterium]|nr:hypothetical protein [Thermoanaerobaculia bacterium]
MPEPLPLADLLASLRDQGLPLGVREHLTVGRLLARWDDTDTSSLRIALSAVLARNPDEIRLVRDTFDRLYGALPDEAAPKPAPAVIAAPRRWRLSRGWIAGLTAAALALALVLGALLLKPAKPPEQELLSNQELADFEASLPPPEIPDTFFQPDWQRSFGAAAGLSAVLFLWLFGVRLRRETQSRARRRLADESDALPGPHKYDFALGDLALPFSRDLLDDAASLLGRRTSIPPRHGDLDVERTLARTLRAGLAPHIVLRARASTHPILVLEDVGDEMRPWRRRTSALLDGLETRGVPLDRYRFHASAGRVFRYLGAPPMTLKQLFRLRGESPLLVVSAGEGILEGFDGRPAPWVEALQGWRYQAWLQPVTDPSYWRPALHDPSLHVWPMTQAGVLAAARQLIHGGPGRPAREDARAERRVSPLDVERLRWLLTLAPRRDPDLAELLRQRFCPHVPPAALLEALEAPPLTSAPGVGPSAEEVHTFLAGVLGASEPPSGTAAHERWRLDRALQEIHVPVRREPATRELASLAQGPLAGEVVSAVERMKGPEAPRLRKRVLRPALAHAGQAGGKGWRWTWPDLVEIGAALVCLGFLGWALPHVSLEFADEVPVTLEKVYSLSVGESADPSLASLTARQIKFRLDPPSKVDAPWRADLYQDGKSLQAVYFTQGFTVGETVEVAMGHWYDLRAPAGKGRLAISEKPVWVPNYEAQAQEPMSTDLSTDYPPPTVEPEPTPEPVAAAPTPRRRTPTASPSRPAKAPSALEPPKEQEASQERLNSTRARLTELLEQAPLSRNPARNGIWERLQNLQAQLDDSLQPTSAMLDRIESEMNELAKNIASGRTTTGGNDPQAAQEAPQEPSLELAAEFSFVAPGGQLDVRVQGYNEDVKVTISGEGVSVLRCGYTRASGVGVCDIEVAKDAAEGPRDVTLIYAEGKSRVYPNLFTVRNEPKKD